MAKPIILVGGVAIAAVVVLGGVLLTKNKNDSPSGNNTAKNTSQSSKEVAVVDPAGTYKLFSDPSVTMHPDSGVKFGNGQTLSFEYDGSKTNNDAYATLSYQLYYIQNNGSVIPMGGGNVEGKGKGKFTVSDKVFNSAAKDRKGFLELQGTYDTSADSSGQIKGKNVTLGMYSVSFDVSN